MSPQPFRFVHAADFHLEQPPGGLTAIPDHLREVFLEAPYRAAERVFDAALGEQADFVILAGDVLDPSRSGPRGPAFLVDQFRKLAERQIKVYWAGARVDPPDAWPSWARLPSNVHVFPLGHPTDLVHQRQGEPVARLVGASRGQRRGLKLTDFAPDPDGLFSLGVIHGTFDAEALAARRVHYWALGGRHGRQTLFHAPHVAHYPGSPQGRSPAETGPHGCTLVNVDPHGQARTSPIATDALRWHNERLAIDDTVAQEQLPSLLHARVQAFLETLPATDVVISWTLEATGRLGAELRRGRLATDLLEMLRREYGYGKPALWSAALDVVPPATLPSAWYKQETILGDYLRAIRHYQENTEPLELERYLSEQQLAGSLGSAADLSDSQMRERILREAAMLGADLLSGEEPQP